MNNKGQFSSLIILVVFAFIFIVVSALFIYIGITTKNKLTEELSPLDTEDFNYTEIIDETMGETSRAYNSLYWGSIVIIIGMVLGIFIGSWLVGVHPLWFAPWIIVVFVVFTVSVIISNAYETIQATPELASVFSNFVGANFIMGYLPVWIIVIGFVQLIVMVISWGRRRRNGNVKVF